MTDEATPLTYPEIGATAGDLPAGYHLLHRRYLIGRDGDAFERAAAALLTWRVHRRAGLRIPETPSAATGVEVRMRLGVGPAALRIPCRVVYTVDEPDRRGFAYGTLPGHPEAGEERFTVERDDHGGVVFAVLAFSRPGRWFTSAAGPAAWVVQRLAVDRYGRAAAALVRG